MPLSHRQIKLAYFQRLYNNGKIIECECGCKTPMKSYDLYGRSKRFINGHNTVKIHATRAAAQKSWNIKHKEYRKTVKSARHRMLKIRLIKEFNSKCNDCELYYSGKNAAIYHFHHIDPSTKSFALGNRLTSISWDRIIKEAKKCVMLCANCHELRHSKEF
mgnify:CR=1 FL=1